MLGLQIVDFKVELGGIDLVEEVCHENVLSLGFRIPMQVPTSLSVCLLPR